MLAHESWSFGPRDPEFLPPHQHEDIKRIWDARTDATRRPPLETAIVWIADGERPKRSTALMRNEWAELAATASETDLRERILTGFKSGKPFTPYVPTQPLPAAIGAVLDFGCGLGRNFPYLTTIATRVVGFDLPEMIARMREIVPAGPIELSSDWDAVRVMPFDLIFASLVLQHVPEDWCRRALADFARMAPATYLLARGEGDFGFNALDLAAQSGDFDPGECRVVDHDPGTHQLRVLETVPFDTALAADDPRHFEVLLHSRVFRSRG